MPSPDNSSRPFPAAVGTVTPEEHQRVLQSIDEARLAHPRPNDAARWERHVASSRKEQS